MTEKAQEINLTNITEQGHLDMDNLVLQARTMEVLEETEIISKRTRSKQLAKEMAEAPDAETRRAIRNELVVFNLPLVTHVIKKYGYFNADKFQNGCVGLLKAAETFNIDKDVPFHNYAAFCIETEIRLAYRKQNRAFESKIKGFLDSLDEPAQMGNGDTLDKHDMAEDELSQEMFDELIGEAEVDTIFYQIIIPCIEFYGTRSKDIDMELWRNLEIQYFMELAMVQSQRQRLTFTQMAKLLGTSAPNIRNRHQKVMALIKEECENFGFTVGVHGGVYFEDGERTVRARNRKRRGEKY